MARIGSIISYTSQFKKGVEVSAAKVDLGGGDIHTCEVFTAIGEDSTPLTTDFALTSKVARTGTRAVVGFVDPKNKGVSEPGEKQIYSRDASGNIVASILLDNVGTVTISNDSAIFIVSQDGSIEGNNGSGFFELKASGDFFVNGVTITTNGEIITPTSLSSPSVLAAGKELAGHIHDVTTAPGETSPNV